MGNLQKHNYQVPQWPLSCRWCNWSFVSTYHFSHSCHTLNQLYPFYFIILSIPER